MLLRMYRRWAEKREFKVDMVDFQEGEECGVRGVTLRVQGENVYGNLNCERGVHRLVRISPFDSQARRHTSFASIDVSAVPGIIARMQAPSARHAVHDGPPGKLEWSE